MKRVIALACLFALGVTSAPAQESRVRVRGTIVSLDGNVLTIATSAENRRVNLADGFRVSWIVKSNFSKIVPGSYIGAAAVALPDGTLRAQEVLIFPESMRGIGEGHQPYDLGPQSTMTNGTVDSGALVESVGGHVLTVKYKDGEKKIVVPLDVPVVTYETADAKTLAPGGNVYIVAQRAADGTLSAARVAVGKNGLIPPM